MTLSIFTNQRVDGLAGVGGTGGSGGTTALPNGQAGSNGTSGQSRTLNFQNQTFIGDPGGDTVNVARHSVGGGGGDGGTGGLGAAASATTTYSSGPGFSRTDLDFGPAGDGGSGGLGGAAGRAITTFANLVFDMAGGAASQNAVTLNATAWGGKGGSSGFAGSGGASSGTGISTTTLGTPPFSSIFDRQGTPGGIGPDGANGSAGGFARVTHSNLTVTGENVLVTLYGTALAGAGGTGGTGGRSGNGSTPLPTGNGGDGGNGGAASTTVSGLSVTVTGGLTLNVILDAGGGAGGNAGGGALPASGYVFSETLTDTARSSLYTTTFGAAGAGGDGGRGGAATASMTGTTITGSAAVDNVTITLKATGGLGGIGRDGATGVASSSTILGTATTTTVGTPDGVDGLNGAAGKSTVTFTNNIINLGDGNDKLTLGFVANGPGAKSVLVHDNTLNGGLGQDTLTLGTQTQGEAAAVVNVGLGTLQIGKSGSSSMTGFEVFRGGAGNDRFIDGAGNHTYSGGFGADRFEFAFGLAGADRIESFVTEDVIRLTGFGGGLDSFADVLVATTDTAAGALIQTSATSSILLAGVTEASLQANDFLFV